MSDNDGCLGAAGLVFALLLVIAWAMFSAVNEARSYRKFCATPVTWWDALFLDLRIDECASGEKNNEKER